MNSFSSLCVVCNFVFSSTQSVTYLSKTHTMPRRFKNKVPVPAVAKVRVEAAAESGSEYSSEHEVDSEGNSVNEYVLDQEELDEEYLDAEQYSDGEQGAVDAKYLNEEEDVSDDEIVENNENLDDDDSTDWIFDRIASIKDSEVGQFVENNKALFFIHDEVQKIRHLIKRTESDETSSFATISEQMSELSLQDKFSGSLKELSKVTEFIFEMHHKYSVKLTAKGTDANEFALVDFVRSAVRKYTKVLLSCVNVFLLCWYSLF